MKKLTLKFWLIAGIILLLLTSCAKYTTKGKASAAEEKGRAKLEQVDERIKTNTTAKLDIVAELAYGTDYALSKVNEPPREVIVARDMNQRVMTLAGTPALDKIKEMQIMIDKLTSQLGLEQDAGKLMMNKKDLQIVNLQKETKVLLIAKDQEIEKYKQVAAGAAANADAYKEALDDYKGWMGLKAVGKGLWQFVTSSAWILGIGSLVFFILRIASASNPVCGAIFGILEQIVAWILNAVKVIFPKAFMFAGQVSKQAYDASQMLLKKIVDNVQSIKEIEKRTGRDITLKELLTELDKAMDKNEKVTIEQIKKDLGY